MQSSMRRVTPFMGMLVVLTALAVLAAPAAAQVGRGCIAFSPCGQGFSCQPLSQKCYNSPRQMGQPCAAGYSCGGGLRCAAVARYAWTRPRRRTKSSGPLRQLQRRQSRLRRRQQRWHRKLHKMHKQQ